MANPEGSFRPPFLLLLVGAASRIALRLAHGGRFADVAFPDLYFVLLFLILWCHLSPPGSAACRWARFAILVAFSCILLGIACSSVGPPALTPEAVVWGIAGFGILALVYVFINC